MSATAGEGQKNHEITIMTIPIVQNAREGVFMIRAKGEIIKSLIPVDIRILLIEEMIEITSIIESSSLIAYIKLVKMPLMDAAKDPVEMKASKKIPAIQTIVMSRLEIINNIVRLINTRYTQCKAVNSIPTCYSSLQLHSVRDRSLFFPIMHLMKREEGGYLQ